jgi:hypothetical protein
MMRLRFIMSQTISVSQASKKAEHRGRYHVWGVTWPGPEPVRYKVVHGTTWTIADPIFLCFVGSLASHAHQKTLSRNANQGCW